MTQKLNPSSPSIDISLKLVNDEGRIQDFFKGMAELSSGGGKNLPGVAKQIARYLFLIKTVQ